MNTATPATPATTNPKATISRKDLALEALNMARDSLRKRGRTAGKTLTFNELERDAILFAQVAACEAIEMGFEAAVEELVTSRVKSVEKHSLDVFKALEALAAASSKAVADLKRRVETLEGKK